MLTHSGIVAWENTNFYVSDPNMPISNFSVFSLSSVARLFEFYFKAAKMRSRMASIEPTPAILTYFGAPGLPLAAHFE